MKNIYSYSFVIWCSLFLSLGSCQPKVGTASSNNDNAALSLEQRNKTLEALSLKSSKKPIHDSLSSEEIALLEHGDIILRKGYGLISDLIAILLEEENTVTHCGFVIKDSLQPNKIKILHILSEGEHDGMLLEPLETFILDSQENSLAVVRANYPANIRAAVVNEALKFLAAKIPFDMAFDDSDSTAYYCSEMVRNAFMPVIGKDILPERVIRINKEGTTMKNFFNEENFTVVLNHNTRNLK